MKLKIALLAGLVSALFGQAAFAWQPDVTAPDLTLLIAGSTANENGIRDLVKNTLCKSNTDVFEGSNNKAVYCTMDASTVAGLSGSLKVYVRKSGVGGSGNGVGPVCNPSTLVGGYMVVTTTGGSPKCASDVAGHWNCSGFTSEDLTPQVGFSDVAPNEVFSGASNGCGSNVSGAFETVFGIPVTTTLRNALQFAQGLTINSETAANMPTMSGEVFSSVMTGKMLSWNSLVMQRNVYDMTDPNNPVLAVAAGTALPAAVSAAITCGTACDANVGNLTAATKNQATICRRVATSGTFAAQNIRMLQRTCVSGALAPLDSTPSGAGPLVMPLASGAGDIDDCMTAMNNQTTINAYDGTTGSNWAIAHQGVDRDPVATSKGYRFIKLNGVAPTFVNVANGTYKYTVTSTVQWRDELVGDSLLIAQQIATNSASPTALGNVRIHHLFGDSGLMALAENGFTIGFVDNPVLLGNPPADVTGDKLYDTSKPVTPFTHKTDHLSNCIDGLRVGNKNILMPSP